MALPGFFASPFPVDLLQIVMEREVSNPEFNFLYDVRSPEHAYYRWRIYSLASGDTLRRWEKTSRGNERVRESTCLGNRQIEMDML